MISRILSHLALVTLVIFLPVAGAGTSVAASDGDVVMVPGTVKVGPEVEAAVRAALAAARDSLPSARYYAVSALYEKDGWSFVSVVGLGSVAPDLSWRLIKDATWFGLVLVRRSAEGTVGAVEGTSAYSRLLAGVPDTVLDAPSRQSLDPQARRAVGAVTTYRFPWTPGTQMLYGARGLHSADFNGWAGISGWKAVDLVSDGDVSAGHAPNHLLAAAAGSIAAVCDDGLNVAIRLGDLLYAHLLSNVNLHTGAYFSQGDELGQLKTGSFDAACGWASQGDNWFHVHLGFPDTGSFQAEDWTLNFTDALWHRGNATVGVGNWLTAGEVVTVPAAPDPVSPADRSLQPPGEELVLRWGASTGATGYQAEWWDGPVGAAQSCAWVTGTECRIGSALPGHTVYWHVRARNGAGASAWSATRSTTVQFLQVVQPLSLTTLSAATGQPIRARFRLANPGDRPVSYRRLGVVALGSTTWASFPYDEDVILQPGDTYAYDHTQTFAVVGSYVADLLYQDTNGVWRAGLAGSAPLTLTVSLPSGAASSSLLTYLPLALR